MWSDSELVVDTVGIYVENHEGRNRELGALPLAEGEGVRSTLRQGTRKKLRTPEIHQKSSKIRFLQNEPEHVWRLPEVLRVTSDDI